MAEAAAAVRAAHQLHEQAAIFDDPLAIHLTSPGWRFIAQRRWLFRLIVKHFLRLLRPVHGQVLARSRFAEDRLDAAISAGVCQYVMLGAGLDSFAYRRADLSANIKIYELDHPVTQQLKRTRIAALGIATPSNLHYLPINFEHQSVADVLVDSSFDPKQPTFFSWLGTIPYLTRDLVFETLRSIARFQPSGAEIVFDYANTNISLHDQAAVEKLKKFTQRRGEPLITQFDALTLESNMHSLGFVLIENIPQSEWRLHYYDSRLTMDLHPLSVAHMAHAKTQ
jgi:methyltransferase (TIGR00027 family)